MINNFQKDQGHERQGELLQTVRNEKEITKCNMGP
jgi:hypothetical protein